MRVVPRRVLLLSTCILSCCSVAFVLVSVATDNWLEANAFSPNISIVSLKVNYGLYTGFESFDGPNPSDAVIRLVCLNDLGKDDDSLCMYSKRETKDERQRELQRLYKSKETNSDSFLQRSQWVATVIFLSLSTLFCSASLGLSFVNACFNPIETIISTLGLYLWNSLAVVCLIITLAIWAAVFRNSLLYNIVIEETITGQAVATEERLGFSYWILIPCVIIHAFNIGLIFYSERTQKKMSKDGRSFASEATGSDVLY